MLRAPIRVRQSVSQTGGHQEAADSMEKTWGAVTKDITSLTNNSALLLWRSLTLSLSEFWCACRPPRSLPPHVKSLEMTLITE